MNTPSIVIVLLFFMCVAVVPPASAQTPQEVALDAVRTRSSIAPNDPVIDDWISYRLNKLMDDLQVEPKKAGDSFFQAFHDQYENEENSASFKMRFVEQTNRQFTAEFEKGRKLQATIGLTLARALAGINDPNTIPGLSAGLRAEGQPAVRYLCAKSFATLAHTIQNDQTRTREILELLRKAGGQEQNGVVLKAVYQAMFYRDANLDVAVEAILEVIKGQLRMREQGSPACDGAEEVAFNFLRSELNNVSAKNRLVAVLAAYLRLDVKRYLAGGISMEEKYRIELSIDAAERLLVGVVAPPAASAPRIREAIKKAQDRDLNMPLELNKWIGTIQTTGMLNKPPWNVPIGAPIPD